MRPPTGATRSTRRPAAGCFDRRLYFDIPTKHERRDLIDFFLTRKAHEAELDTEDQRDRVASETFGYTPVMIEHLFDEALLVALRDGRREMRLRDVMDAKFDEEVGLKQTTAYTDFDREAVATHEAGHMRLLRTSSGRAGVWRCCRSSNGAARSVCSPTATRKSG